MKILCWNVDRLPKRKRQDIFRFLQDADPDVICLQEMPPNGLKILMPLLEDTGYTCFITASDGTVKTPLHVMTAVRGFSTVSVEPACVLSSHAHQHLLVEAGDFLIANAHIPNASNNSRSTKQEHFSFIENFMIASRHRASLVCGDFNSPKSERDGEYSGFDASMSTKTEHQFWSDLCRLGFRDAVVEGHGASHELISHINKGKGNRSRYDHFLVSEYVCLTGKVEYDTRSHIFPGLSDHAPLTAEVSTNI